MYSYLNISISSILETLAKTIFISFLRNRAGKVTVAAVCPKKGTILDPFMGSGTTGIAATKLDFDFIGIEKEKNYIDIAEKRLKNLSFQSSLF